MRLGFGVEVHQDGGSSYVRFAMDGASPWFTSGDGGPTLWWLPNGGFGGWMALCSRPVKTLKPSLGDFEAKSDQPMVISIFLCLDHPRSMASI